MPDLFLVKARCGCGAVALHPDGVESQVVFDKMPFGKALSAEVKQQRNVKHLRLYWAICHRIANALDRDDVDHEVVSDFFKISTGHFTEVISQTLGLMRRPKSISFAKMDQIAFRDFFEKCIRFAYVEWQIPADVFSDLLMQSKPDPAALDDPKTIEGQFTERRGG